MSFNDTLKDNMSELPESSNENIKTEEQSEMVEIKIENNKDCGFENVQIEIKQELDTNYSEPVLENVKESEILVNGLVDVKSVNSDESITKIKTETENDETQEGGSQFHRNDDVESMDSSEAAALGNVEACLQDELDIKTEHDALEEELREDSDKINVKEEVEIALETQLITNKLIKTTSTINSGELSFLQSHAASTLVLEILPVPTPHHDHLDKSNNPEEILPTLNSDNDYADHFQLNSITGNVLSLEQEAYGLLKAKGDKVQAVNEHPCPECSKMYNSKSGLNRHLAVHRSIEARAMGVVKGLKTRKSNQSKVRKEFTDKKVNIKKVRKECKYIQIKNADNIDGIEVQNKTRRKKADVSEPKLRIKSDKKDKESKLDKKDKEINSETKDTEIKSESDVKKEGYACTCGKVFQRRSRLETCLRSHTEYADADACYACMTCSKQFKHKDELSMHRKKQHRKRFPCKFCPTDYNTRKELFRHLQIHQKVQLMEYKVISEVMEGKQKLKCFMCTKTYVELSELKTHVMEDHKELYVCKFCKETFPKIIDFANHMKTAHSEVEGQTVLDVLEAFSKLVQAWKCEDCGLQFHEADKLALHQIEQHNPDLKIEPQFQCSDCRRVFVSQKALTSHRRVHHSVDSGDETEAVPQGVMCLECRKMCKDMNALTSHMRLHSPERKYPCKFCDFRFATPEKRKTHAEVHTGDMKYVCFICEYQCTSENRLKQHKQSLKHLNMKEFLLTGKPLLEESTSKEKIKDTSKKKDSRKRKSSSSGEISCDVCGEYFADEASMLEHKQTHPFIEFPNEDTPTRIFFK